MIHHHSDDVLSRITICLQICPFAGNEKMKISIIFPVIVLFAVLTAVALFDAPSSHHIRKNCMWFDGVMLTCMKSIKAIERG